jgi:hypothetical protein
VFHLLEEFFDFNNVKNKTDCFAFFFLIFHKLNILKVKQMDADILDLKISLKEIKIMLKYDIIPHVRNIVGLLASNPNIIMGEFLPLTNKLPA